jgi:hypothetical protein
LIFGAGLKTSIPWTFPPYPSPFSIHESPSAQRRNKYGEIGSPRLIPGLA